ncbi:hypothetical protein AWB82_03307 [Caballeronia glebae]|uniref:Uncharacterized protein n=1 Tax=Caballeronia glebae TaxID=1777143 RepID=A0A158B279_9BURK|nr:hypothetical protein AWB82_03307 [Caballeronia glebae]
MQSSGRTAVRVPATMTNKVVEPVEKSKLDLSLTLRLPIGCGR